MVDVSAVKDYWNNNVCGTDADLNGITAPKYSREYFESIEEFRYTVEPFIFSFAQFTRWRDKKVLEVGVGAATDFLQWVRAGARAYGVDLTEAAIEHARHRLSIYGLEAEDLRVCNAEKLTYEDDMFDLVYSWGVIHHSPSIENALAQIVRVVKPGGTVKLMLYHRHAVGALLPWLKWGLMRGRPFKSPTYYLANFVESPDTKMVSRSEVRTMLAAHGIHDVQMQPVLTYYDRMDGYRGPAPIRWAARAATRIAGDRFGWFLMVEFKKPEKQAGAPSAAR